MAKKKKNSNYGGAPAAKKAATSEAPRSTMQYGLPGWVVLICLVLLCTALALQPGVDNPDWKNTVAYLMVGAPAMVLATGQRKVQRETKSKMAGVLAVLFTFIGAMYLISGITTLGSLLRG